MTRSEAYTAARAVLGDNLHYRIEVDEFDAGHQIGVAVFRDGQAWRFDAEKGTVAEVEQAVRDYVQSAEEKAYFAHGNYMRSRAS